MKDFNSFKKITTEDCINAICELLYHQGKSGADLNKKNWKRRSKSGSDIIVRTFENVVTGQIMVVSETKNQIFRIIEDKDVPSKSVTDSIFKGLELLYINNDITNDGMSLCVVSYVKNGKILSYLDKDDSKRIINANEDTDFGANVANLDFALGDDKDADIEKKIEDRLYDLGLNGEMEGIFSADENDIEDIISKLESMGAVVYRNKYNKKTLISKSPTDDIFSDLKGSVLFPDENLSKDFPFVYTFDYATIYSKSKINDRRFSDETEEIENDDYDSSGLSEGTRIGILNPMENDIETLIVITTDTVFYSNNGDMTNDGISYFELAKGVHYVPAQEPVDLLEWDFCNGGGCEIEEADKMRKVAKKYKLNHFLISV